LPIGAAPPASIVAGDTVSFAYSSALYPASSGWGMIWRLVGPGVAVDLAIAANGAGFTVSAPPAATSGLVVPPAGIPCTLLGAASAAGERFTVYRAPCKLEPDPATVAGDLRSQAAQTLEAISALLAGRASMDQQSYRIGDRELARIPIPELLQLREYYKAEVRRVEAAEAALQGRIARRTRSVYPRMVRS
jgi:hypothetical protein